MTAMLPNHDQALAIDPTRGNRGNGDWGSLDGKIAAGGIVEEKVSIAEMGR
jgi:hypothetical protein